MTALTAGRATPSYLGGMREGQVAAATRIFTGAIVMRNAAGLLINGATATGRFGVGVAQSEADNSTGADGAINVKYTGGVWRFDNSAAADLIALADVGKVCFIVDDQTVAKTNGTATRSPAGIIEAVDAQGVWVRFDEALTRAS